jgi:cytochrome c oxidase subunit 2
MRIIRALLLAFTMLVFVTACEPTAQPDEAAVAAASGSYKTCAGCHGANGEGNASLQAPALVNLDSWYLKRQMDNFRSGIRGSNANDTWGLQMAAQSAVLTNAAEVDAVVAQIDAFANTAPAVTISGDVARGKDFYSMTCGACHGPDGVGNQALNAPSLRGLDDWYLVRQYGNFRDGLRGTHAEDVYGQQMQRMGKVLKSDQDIRDVAAYLTSLGIDG